MSYTTGQHPIIKELMDEGLIPPHCYNFELRAPASGVLTLHVETLVTEEQFRKIADALLRDPIEAARITRYVVKNPTNGEAVKVGEP